jgi:phosphohistidine phosphatase
LELTHDLYEASVRSMLQIINELDDQIGSVVVVGHNPTISYLADYLSKDPIQSLSPAGVVYLEFQAASWHQLEKASSQKMEVYENFI